MATASLYIVNTATNNAVDFTSTTYRGWTTNGGIAISPDGTTHYTLPIMLQVL